jgi:iron-sulfur cluster assembly protein/iron-sulfur cluster insertion protein
MYFDSERSDGDSVNEVNDAVRVVVDPESAKILKGATLDYKDSLQGAGFHLDNPNASRSCGCGSSFS